MTSRVQGTLTHREEFEVMRANRAVLWFFFLICQFLIVWSVYMLSQISSKIWGASVGASRMIDVMSSCLSVSSIFMLYGISASIKRALQTQHEQETRSFLTDDIASLMLFDQ